MRVEISEFHSRVSPGSQFSTLPLPGQGFRQLYSLLSVTDARGGERCADRTHTYRYVVCAPPGYRPGDVPTGCAPTTGRCRLPGIGRECSFIVCAAEAAELARGGAYKRGNSSTTCLEPKPLPPLQEAHGASMRSRRFHILLLSSPSYTIRVAASTRCARVRVLRLTEMGVFLLPHSHPLSTLFQYIHRSDDSARRSLQWSSGHHVLTTPTS